MCGIALSTGLLGVELSAQKEGEQEKQHDPYQGMDRSGRIPKIDLPFELKNRGRWRYFPEGRLLHGTMLERFMVSSFFSPILFSESDVGTGGGVAITDVDFRNQRRREFANIVLTYSSEGQQAYSINWRRWANHIEVPGGGVVQDERSYMHFNGGFTKSLTNRYFGRGPDTVEAAESNYTRERSALSYAVQFTEPDPADDIILRWGVSAEHNRLASGFVNSLRNTSAAFAGDFAAGQDHDLFWINLSGRIDTRDSVHNPYDGYYLGITANTAIGQTHGNVGGLYSVYGSKVFTVPPLLHDGGDEEEEHPPTDSLAFGVYTQLAAGDLPFYVLPTLGGSSTLRGYVNNRFTDRSAWHASAEYRFWFVPRGFRFTDHVRVERIGAALFYDVGSVAASFSDFFDDKPKHSFGVSLRFSLERTALFRVDYGVSDEGNNLTIRYGLTF